MILKASDKKIVAMMNDDGFDATQDYVSRRKKAEDVLIVMN
jgi:hypothetical protein